MRNKYIRLVGDIWIFAIGALGSKLVLFLLLPLYTNILSDNDYGIADLVITVGDLLLPFASIGIYNGLLRFGLVKDKRNNALLGASLVFLCGCAFTILLTPLLGIYKPITVWKWYLCAYVIVHFARLNSLVYLKVKNKNKLYSILSIIQALMLVACNIIMLIILSLGIRGYLLSTIISNALLSIVAFALGSTCNDIKTAVLDKSLLKEMILYSVPFIFNDISWWIIHSSDKLMIEWMISGAMLGIYTAASKIPSLLNVVTSIFSQAWGLASIKEFDSTNDTGFYSRVFLCYAILIYGAAVAIITVTKPFMSVYVGEAFKESWHFVPLLLVSAVFLAFASFTGSLYGAIKKSRIIMTTTFIASAVNIGLNYIFIKHIGVYGAVVGTVSAYFIVALLRIMDLRKRINIDFHLKKVVLLTFIVLGQAVLVGFDYHVYLVSLVTIALFCVVVKKDVALVYHMIMVKIQKKSPNNLNY